MGIEIGNLWGIGVRENGRPIFVVSPSCKKYLGKYSGFLIGFLTVWMGGCNVGLRYIGFYSWFWINFTISVVVVLMINVVAFFTPGIQICEYVEGLKPYDPKRFCVVCSVNREKGTKHCQICDVCVLSKGKHIEAFDKCIGRYTKIPFYLAISGFVGVVVICTGCFAVFYYEMEGNI